HDYKSCGDPATSDLFPQNDCTLLIQANHIQRVFAGIDANRADGCGVCLEGLGGALLVLLSPRSLSERFGAGARPVHPILRHMSMVNKATWLRRKGLLEMKRAQP